MKDENVHDILNQFNVTIAQVDLDTPESDKSKLAVLFNNIVLLISKDYETYRRYVPRLLSIVENYSSSSFPLLMQSYLTFYYKIIKEKNVSILDNSVLKTEVDADIPDKFLKVMENSLKKEQKIRLSEFEVNIDGLSQNDKSGIITLMHDSIHFLGEKLEWNDDDVQNVLMGLPLLRILLKDQNNTSLFYFICGQVLDRYGSSEYFQQSRNLSEELLITSFQDNQEHLGFLNYFKCYSNSSSTLSGLLYANLSFTSVLTDPTKLNDKYLTDIIWQGIKFFRNISIHNLVKDIYESIPSHINFDAYEKRSITHSYFYSLLAQKEPNIPQLISDYLNKNREDICAGDIYDARPWLITLYNVQRMYSKTIFISSGLVFYVNLFEMIVPKELVEEQKTVIQGNSELLKPLLRKSLIKLNETIYSSDLIQDNSSTILIANRIIANAVEDNDYEALLLAMIIKVDFSFTFSEKERLEVANVNIPTIGIDVYNEIYESFDESIEKLNSSGDFTYLWLITAEQNFYQLELFEKEFKSEIIENWDFDEYRKLMQGSFFSSLVFDDTIKTNGEVRLVLFEEFEQDSELLKKKFLFTKINIEESSEPLLLILDVNFAGFPHNLLIDSKEDFISLKRPLCNILSLEWYLKYSNQKRLNKEYSKAIWIPTDGGDMAINYLFAKLEDILDSNSFDINTALELDKPIESNLNIVCAHGADDIALKQVIYPDSNPRINLNKFLGKGEVLIFFVCHSGSTKPTPFKNSISSIIKQFITNGYSSVIAPFWALHINIPPIWLPIFLESIDSGQSIVEAVYNANLKVSKTYPTLSAWSCMHLYGDPHLCLE